MPDPRPPRSRPPVTRRERADAPHPPANDATRHTAGDTPVGAAPGAAALPRIDVSVSGDGARALVAMHASEQARAAIELSLDQLTTLIQTLGQVRTAMVASRPVPPMDGASINPVFVTQWAVQPEALTEGSVIAFQHPAFGPVGFVLPPADAERVVRALGAHLGMMHSREATTRKPS